MSVTVNDDRLDAIIYSLRSRTEATVAELAQRLADEVQDVILQMHIYKSGDTYESVRWYMESNLKAVIDVTAKSPQGYRYPIRIHNGYHTSTGLYVPPRPFMRVAFERFRRGNFQLYRRLIE